MKISLSRDLTLYHGTCRSSADRLLKNGWKPGQSFIGGNAGQSRYLYLTDGVDNALWFAQEKGCNVVLSVKVPFTHLEVDPEDGTEDTVQDELHKSHGLPAYLVSTKPLPARAFRVL